MLNLCTFLSFSILNALSRPIIYRMKIRRNCKKTLDLRNGCTKHDVRMLEYGVRLPSLLG